MEHNRIECRVGWIIQLLKAIFNVHLIYRIDYNKCKFDNSKRKNGQVV